MTTTVGEASRYRAFLFNCLPEKPKDTVISNSSWKTHGFVGSFFSWSLQASFSYACYRYPLAALAGCGITAASTLIPVLAAGACVPPASENPLKSTFHAFCHLSANRDLAKALLASGVLILDGGIIYLSTAYPELMALEAGSFSGVVLVIYLQRTISYFTNPNKGSQPLLEIGQSQTYKIDNQ